MGERECAPGKQLSMKSMVVVATVIAKMEPDGKDKWLILRGGERTLNDPSPSCFQSLNTGIRR